MYRHFPPLCIVSYWRKKKTPLVWKWSDQLYLIWFTLTIKSVQTKSDFKPSVNVASEILKSLTFLFQCTAAVLNFFYIVKGLLLCLKKCILSFCLSHNDKTNKLPMTVLSCIEYHIIVVLWVTALFVSSCCGTLPAHQSPQMTDNYMADKPTTVYPIHLSVELFVTCSQRPVAHAADVCVCPGAVMRAFGWCWWRGVAAVRHQVEEEGWRLSAAVCQCLGQGKHRKTSQGFENDDGWWRVQSKSWAQEAHWDGFQK